MTFLAGRAQTLACSLRRSSLVPALLFHIFWDRICPYQMAYLVIGFSFQLLHGFAWTVDRIMVFLRPWSCVRGLLAIFCLLFSLVFFSLLASSSYTMSQRCRIPL